jgi:hypothetical protein
MTVATELEEFAPNQAPARPETMTGALIAWQAAERQLASIPASSPEGNALRAEIEALRLLYKQLSGQFAAQTTPLARATPAAPLRAVGPGMPVAPEQPVDPVTPDSQAEPVVRAAHPRPKAVGRTAPDPRPKPVARAKPDARPKPRVRSTRAS